MCDDGNKASSDGCNSQCLIEEGYVCRGGLYGNKDSCNMIETEFESISIDSNYFAQVRFTNPVFFSN